LTEKRLWTDDEDTLIQKMVGNRAALQDIAKALTDRIFQTVEKRISRLKLQCRQTKKFFLRQYRLKNHRPQDRVEDLYWCNQETTERRMNE